MQSLSASPTSVDVTNGSAQVKITGRFTDDREVAGASVYLRNPNFAGTHDTSSATFVKTSGTGQDGTWEATVTIPEDSPPGEYYSILSLRDASNNQIVDTQTVRVNVASRDADVTKPVMQSLSASPTSVDVTNGSAQVKITGRFTDDREVAGASVYLRNPNFAGTHDTSSATFVKTSGTGQDGTWEATVTIPEDSPPGEYYSILSLRDASNNQIVDTQTVRVNVASRDADVTKPVMQSLSASPTSVDVTNGSAQVKITGRFTDDREVAGASVYLRNPNFAGTHDTSSATFVKTSGTGQDGTWEATVTIPEDSPPGEYYSILSLRDASNNQIVDTQTVRVDVNVPPETTLDPSGPSGRTNSTSAAFSYSSEPGASFECKLDRPATPAPGAPARPPVRATATEHRRRLPLLGARQRPGRQHRRHA